MPKLSALTWGGVFRIFALILGISALVVGSIRLTPPSETTIAQQDNQENCEIPCVTDGYDAPETLPDADCDDVPECSKPGQREVSCADGRTFPCDNCPETRNPTQRDRNGDGEGDICEAEGAVTNPDLNSTTGQMPAAAGVLAAQRLRDLAAAAYFDQDQFLIFTGDGRGNFTVTKSFIPAGGPTAITSGDFNNDGLTDFVVGSVELLHLSLLLGRSNGTFTDAIFSPVGQPISSLAAGDFNGDGNQDVAVTVFEADQVLILNGNGAGRFVLSKRITVGQFPLHLTAADFNNDHILDLAVACFDGNEVRLLRGDGKGEFQLTHRLNAGVGPAYVAVGQLNNDGLNDLVVANIAIDQVTVVLSNDGQYRTAGQFVTGDRPAKVTLGDLNGDNRLDMAIANLGNSTITIMLGLGNGAFIGFGAQFLHPPLGDMTMGDFTGDGKLDIAWSNTEILNNIRVLRNKGDGTFF